MKKLRGPTLSLRAKGPLAIFTRPELKTERVSYEVPTPSAVRGIPESLMQRAMTLKSVPATKGIRSSCRLFSRETELIIAAPLCTMSPASIARGLGLSMQQGRSTASCTFSTSHRRCSGSPVLNDPALTSI